MNRISQRTITAAQLIDDEKRFGEATVAAVRDFARTKPWRGTIAERSTKFSALHAALCGIYGVSPRLVINVPDEEGGPGASLASRGNRRELRLLKRLSVVTYLNLFAQAAGHDSAGAFRWSLNLFKRCFPRSFATCRQNGVILVR